MTIDPSLLSCVRAGGRFASTIGTAMSASRSAHASSRPTARCGGKSKSAPLGAVLDDEGVE
eukprot:1914212-Alexandrium_andersonii.AAC.1